MTLKRNSALSHVWEGIGAAIAENLASKGSNLLLNYTSSSSIGPTNEICERLSKKFSVKCVPVQADLSEPAGSCPTIVSTAKEHFTSASGDFVINILVNNAGIAGDKRLGDPDKGPIEPTQFYKMYTVNVLAVILLTQECMPYLPKDRSGRIINLSSVSSSLGFEGQTIYGGTKAAVEHMTRTWSRELADRCTVNAVNPGPVWGDMYSEAGEAFWKSMQPFQDTTPLSKYNSEEQVKARAGDEAEKFDRLVTEKMGGRRPGFTSEIAGVVGMLCSEDSGWCTGSVVCCNGGLKMGM